jgi:hypothetical protein
MAVPAAQAAAAPDYASRDSEHRAAPMPGLWCDVASVWRAAFHWQVDAGAAVIVPHEFNTLVLIQEAGSATSVPHAARNADCLEMVAKYSLAT